MLLVESIKQTVLNYQWFNMLFKSIVEAIKQTGLDLSIWNFNLYLFLMIYSYIFHNLYTFYYPTDIIMPFIILI